MWTYKNVSMPRSQIARNLGMAWRGAGCGIRTVCGCDCRAVDTFQFPDLMVNEADYSGGHLHRHHPPSAAHIQRLARQPAGLL